MNFAARPGTRQIPSHDDPEYKKWLEEEQNLIDRYEKRSDMSWRDHLVMLLTFGAAAEHCLMVQYLYATLRHSTPLYAAYSLHTEDRERSPRIENWRSNILAICKEEMGQLLTVQNILLFLGAPATLGRENPVWAQKYYPYPFSLDPLNLDSLRCFVYAEIPDPDSRTYADLPKYHRDMLKKLVESVDDRFSGGKADVHRVGALYNEIIDLISDEQRIPDTEFDESSYDFQASWDPWGRGYRPAPYELDARETGRTKRKTGRMPIRRRPLPASRSLNRSSTHMFGSTAWRRGQRLSRRSSLSRLRAKRRSSDTRRRRSATRRTRAQRAVPLRAFFHHRQADAA